MRASCTSRVRFDVMITIGGVGGAERAQLGHRDRVVGQHLEQERLELVVGPVDLVDEQHRRRALAVVDGPQQRAAHEEALGVQLVLELVGARAGGLARWPRRPAGAAAGGSSPTRRRPGWRRCPRSTAGGSARRRSSGEAPWPPRSCRRRPRPRAAAGGGAAAPGRWPWPGPRRRGTRARRGRRRRRRPRTRETWPQGRGRSRLAGPA